MSLVLPTDVEGVSTSRALGKAAIWASSVFLLATFVLVVAYKVVIPQANIALALAGLAIAGLSVAWALVASRPAGVFLLMLVGAGGVFLFTFQIAADVGPGWGTDAVLFSTPKIAMTVVGVAGRSLPACIVRSTVGFVFASVAVQLGAQLNGLTFTFDIPSIVTWASVVLLLLTLWAGRAHARQGVDTMRTAAEDEERISERSRIAARASAALHDTVLNDLHALTLSSPGELLEAHRAFLARDIASLAHPGLLVDEAMLRGRLSGDAISSSGLGAVIESAQNRGLRVAVSGEPGLLTELDTPVLTEVVRAVDQALINVSKHAAVGAAEVAIASGSDSVNVVVSDAGVGFDPKAVDEQRLGISVSIKQRIEHLDGNVLVWSTPGMGTAVLMSVPRAHSGAETS